MDQSNDSEILQQRIVGKSVVALAEQYRVTTNDIEAAIDRRLKRDLTNDQRLKEILLDCARIETLMVPFIERATKAPLDQTAIAAGTLCCKLLERRALLLGLDQPAQSRVDVYQMQPPAAASEFDQVFNAVMRVARGPNWQPNGGGDGAVDVVDAVPSADDAKPIR